ncbi:hypothetical protein RFI_06496 [Reticulomyxa filosa]|uniref:Uncharacterized protein n=1 Tax=Reticulomyxa filosa TaxID=46433 RepID=X6NWD5_RETFI|nr:hypothetical protein RFI_06496 [Reticulomyxa filosa]|eukprot:ETO30625.1 hypothetical protein RFI_06496 [Reticulomyxa filosa]
MLPPLKPVQDREISSSQPNWLRRLKTAEPGATKEFTKWPSNHPYSYTVGDVVKEKALDLRTGQMTDLWFAHPDVYAEDPKKRKTRKTKFFYKKKKKRNNKVWIFVFQHSDIDNVMEQFRIKFHIYFNWLLTKGMNYLFPLFIYQHLEFFFFATYKTVFFFFGFKKLFAQRSTIHFMKQRRQAKYTIGNQNGTPGIPAFISFFLLQFFCYTFYNFFFPFSK